MLKAYKQIIYKLKYNLFSIKALLISLIIIFIVLFVPLVLTPSIDIITNISFIKYKLFLFSSNIRIINSRSAAILYKPYFIIISFLQYKVGYAGVLFF